MTCKYCKFTCETDKQMLKHLNETHTKCAYCGTVFDDDEFEDTLALCGDCREDENDV